jgi:hypothetical protein
MKRLIGFAGMLLATSAGAGEPGHSILQSATVTKPGDVVAGHKGAARRICESRAETPGNWRVTLTAHEAQQATEAA